MENIKLSQENVNMDPYQVQFGKRIRYQEINGNLLKELEKALNEY